MAALDQESLVALIRDQIREEVGAAEKRIVARIEELLPLRKKKQLRPSIDSLKVDVELAAAIGTDRQTARHLMVAIHNELGRRVELEDVPDLGKQLKPAQEVASNALQWAVRSLALAKQRTQTREEKKPAEEQDAKQALAFWCLLVRTQCKEGAKEKSTKLPAGCGRIRKPRRGSKAWRPPEEAEDGESQEKRRRRRSEEEAVGESKADESSSHHSSRSDN
jgi:hypothetical protein